MPNPYAPRITHRAVSLDDAIYEVVAEINSMRPHNYSRIAVHAVANELYHGAWWLEDLVDAAWRELNAA